MGRSDDHLLKKCLSSYNSVRNTFEDLLSLKKHDNYFNMVRDFGCKKDVDVYSFSELKERYYVLFWLVQNLFFPRVRSSCWGVPVLLKQALCNGISACVFCPSTYKRLYRGRYALWVIDEFSGYELDLETLNMILDGQRMQLDSKYGKVFEKMDNVPVLMLGNSVPYIYNCDSFKSRVLEIRDCSPLNSTRLALTMFMLAVRFIRTSPDRAFKVTPPYSDPMCQSTKRFLSNCGLLTV